MPFLRSSVGTLVAKMVIVKGVIEPMQISISGKNMDMGFAFQEHAEMALGNVVEKYFQNAISGHVTLEKADSGFTVRTRVALSRRIELESTGRADDAHAALEAALEHAEKRLRRHKRRLKNHRSTITAAEENDVDIAPMKIYAAADHLTAEQGDADDLLPIVADLSYDIEVLTVEQAVMRLELSNSSMLMFRNASHFGLNVVHIRDDGSIGWIDPRGARRLANGH